LQNRAAADGKIIDTAKTTAEDVSGRMNQRIKTVAPPLEELAMKTSVSIAVVIAAFLLQLPKADAVVVAGWTFETSQPAATDSATISGIVAEQGTGTASGVHASSATDWSNPAGNGSAESFSANTWAIGDYFQFSFSTAVFQDVSISWDQTRSSTGPATFDLTYSLNGGAFVTGLNDYSVLENATTTTTAPWSSTTPRQAVYIFNLPSVPAMNDVASVVVRLVADSAPGGTGGTNRVDNFFVEAVAIPEASSFVFAGLIGGVYGIGRVGRRMWRTVRA